MSLYAERARDREYAKREGAGNDVFSTELTERARGRIARAARKWLFEFSFDDAVMRVEEDEGLPVDSIDPSDEGVADAIRHGEHDLACSLIEALLAARRRHPKPDYDDEYYWKAHVELLPLGWFYDQFREDVQRVLRSERIAMRLVDDQLIDFGSEELHEEIVAPTLKLLAGKTGWSAVEASYQKALAEIGEDSADAITDAGTALQEALLLRGAEGKSLGPLSRSARDIGLLAGHDLQLADAIFKIVSWVSADRANRGDTHNATPAQPEDAWLAVHVVGALIVRLSTYSP